MRKDKSIVFIDLWTHGITPFYYTKSHIDSFVLVLFNYKYIDFIRIWIKDMIAFFKKNFANESDFCMQTDNTLDLYRCSNDDVDKECCLATCFRFYVAFVRISQLLAYVKERGKCLGDMTWDIHGFHDKEYQVFYDKVKYSTMSSADFMKDLRIKANCESDSILVQFQ